MIRKYQGAGKPNRFWNFLTNATLRSAVNENPSIATSTGYEVNPDTGAVTQDPAALDKTARPELANLRNNLAVMSGTAYAAPAAPALVNAAVSNPITTGKFLTSMLGGMAVDEGVRTYTGFDGWGDLLYNKSGTRHLVEKLPEDMQQKVAPASKFLWGFANPGFYTEGITNQLYRGAKQVVPAAKQLVKEAEAVNYAGRKADNALTKSLFSTSPVVNTVGTFDIVKSQPYARIAPTDLRINTATDYGLRYDPKNYVQLINDTEPGYYSVHFKTDKGSPTSNAVQKVVDKIVSDLPGGSKVATWGSVTKGGFSGLDRFGKAGMIRTGEFRPLAFKDPSVANEVAKKYGLTLNTDGTINLANTQKSTIRLYRAQPVNPTFDSTKAANGEAQREFAGQWFTPDIKKVDWYAHNASTGGVPTELQYVDILEDALPKYAADKHVPKTFDFEPEDYIIPNTIERVTIPYNNTTRISTFDDPSKKLLLKTSNANVTINWPIRRKLYDPQPLSKAELVGLPKVERNQPYKPTTWLQGDDAVNMFKTYGVKEPVVENSPLMEQIRKYVPEARERYGLWGNTNITDEEIAGALYKRAFQLSGENNGAVNAYGEPIILFRGDTQRYPIFKERLTPERLAKGSGTMDNSLGTLFLGEYPYAGDQGIERYLGRYYSSNSKYGKFNSTSAMSSDTGSKTLLPENVSLESQLSEMVPLDGGVYKLKGAQMQSGVNDINAFVVKSPNVRDATNEISVLNDQALARGYWGSEPHMSTKYIEDETGFPMFLHPDGTTTPALFGYDNKQGMAEHYRYVLDDALSKQQGLLMSRPNAPLRDEHQSFTYYALPNFNRHNAKHLLGYDLNYPLENSWMLYRKQGGKI